MPKLKLPLLIAFILCLNVVIYLRAPYEIVPSDNIFAECARNSGRTSAAINLLLLFMLGHFGLKTIYSDKVKLGLFQTLATLFAVNHLIHFFFVSQNFKLKGVELTIADSLHGFITFICLILLPVLLYTFKSLNKLLYFLILFHFFNITYLISKSFYSRYKPIDPAYLHRIGVLVMIMAIIYVLYRMYAERSSEFSPRPLNDASHT